MNEKMNRMKMVTGNSLVNSVPEKKKVKRKVEKKRKATNEKKKFSIAR